MNIHGYLGKAMGTALAALGVTGALALSARAGASYQKRSTFAETMVATREKSAGAKLEELAKLVGSFQKDFPMEFDWLSQDFIRPDLRSIKDERQRMAARLELQGVGKGHRTQISKNLIKYMAPDRDAGLEQDLIEKVIKGAGSKGYGFRSKARKLRSRRTKVTEPAWLNLYVEACKARRRKRLAVVAKSAQKILFIKRKTIRPSFFAYTEGQSDSQSESHYHPGSSLCLWQTSNGRESVKTLIDSPDGVIRDLDVSWDGKRVLFAWKKGRNKRADDYHLYEMNASTGKVRQLTQGKGVADFEGRYLPNGDILFNSSRCVEQVDCWKVEVSNLYTCDKDGKYLRRLGFDQVHTVYPSVLDDGNVIYTRWDYNDRGQTPPQPLFTMGPDGTGQTEYYGNNSYFPTTINHARGIPGTKKVLAVLHGHHTWQAGKLAIIDNKRGRQEGNGVEFVAPRRDIKKKYIDCYGQEEELFRHPWPLNEEEYIVAMSPDRQARHSPNRFGLYYMDIDGNRELLHYDTNVSCAHPIVLAPRKRPHQRVSTVDYSKDYGTYVMQDVYVGPGLKGIPRGTVKKLRVVALEFRAAWIQNNGSRGEAGRAFVSTPISTDNGCWDVKVVLGEAKVHSDGSAMFKVPAQTPLYFQCIDGKGQVVQTMRSWSTLQPGETFGCVGCHEDKNSTPISNRRTMAARKGAQELDPFYGPARGFSFIKEVQPILDKNCIKCHNGQKKSDKGQLLINLTSKPGKAGGGRAWSEAYLNLTRKGNYRDRNNPVCFLESQCRPSMIQPYYKGSAKSRLVKMLREGHSKTKLSKEDLDKICAWIDLGIPFCGDYMEANTWNRGDLNKYIGFQRKRERYAEECRRNTEAFAKARSKQRIKLKDPAPRYAEWEK